MPKNFASKGQIVPLLIHGIKEVGVNNLTESDLLAIKNFIKKSEDTNFDKDLLTAPHNIRTLVNRIIDKKEYETLAKS